MSKYSDRLSLTDKEKAAGAATLAEANAKAQVEQKISGLKAEAATLAAAYNEALGTNPFNINKVFSLTTELDTNKKNLAIAESILTTEF